jgi:SM-20-related protein
VPRELFAINPHIARDDLAADYRSYGRVQVRDVLTPDTAYEVQALLAKGTPWGLGWRAGDADPRNVRAKDLAKLSQAEREAMWRAGAEAMAGNGYAFQFAQYPMLDAYLGKWDAGGAHDILLEHINAEPFLDLVRDITGVRELIKADAQATLYAPGHFLALHNDSHVGEGWRVAYVLNMCAGEWRPDWGGYLNFYNEEGDVVAGYRPRFNALNLFAVPQKHAVTFVPPFAPVARFAITGWFRDR